MSSPAASQESSARRVATDRPRAAGRGSPLVLAVLAMAAAAAFVGARLHSAAHGDIARFVVPGSHYSHAGQTPSVLPTAHGAGYDGQFYFRLALDPFDFHRTAFGITVDHAYRFQRITFSLIVWLVTGGGTTDLVPWAMVLVNIALLGVLAWCGGDLARRFGRHAAWGVILVAYPGFFYTLARDTTEIAEGAFLALAMVASTRRRPMAMGLALAAAVLSRESSLFVVLAVGLVSVADMLRRRRFLRRSDLAWIIPGCIYVGWQLLVYSKSGTLPATSAGGNFGAPFVGISQHAGSWFRQSHTLVGVLQIVETVQWVAVVVLLLVAIRTSRAPGWVRLAAVLLLVLTLCLAGPNWVGYTNYRNLSTFYVVAAAVILGSRVRLEILAASLVGVCAVAAVSRVTRI
ncbi:MAG TPA: hypothetical protein VGH85_21635 [Mycobacteriales bacterium]|jgi:hypothetical protein